MLQDGNTVQIGELLLTFSSRLVSDPGGDEEQSTVYAAIDVVNQSSSKNFPVVRPEVKLRALRLISQELGGTLVLTELLDRIFNSLFELFPRAERGFVLVRDPASQTLVPEAIRSRTGPPGELTISKTVLNRVLNEGQAILSKDLAKEFPESQSVSESEIRSLMCVPLLDQERKPVGIMQIDTRDGRGRFDQDDLDLLVAVASQISVAVQNARLHKALVRQREMEQELLFARQVMTALLPERPASVPGYEFWAYYEPARHVGGDYYGFFPIGPVPPARRRGDVLGGRGGGRRRQGDAGGTADRQALGRGAAVPPGRSGPGVGRRPAQSPVRRRRRAGPVHHVPAGHPGRPAAPPQGGQRRPPVPDDPPAATAGWRRSGDRSPGLPLGIMPGYPYEVAETTLEPGETVILYTDGVTDAMNAANDRFGETRHAAGPRPPPARAPRRPATRSSRPCSGSSPSGRSSTTSPWSAWRGSEPDQEAIAGCRKARPGRRADTDSGRSTPRASRKSGP